MADPAVAEQLRGFFKTGPGEYGEGDRFLGLRVPALRRLAREYDALALADVTELLRSAWHEERLLALLILVRRYARGTPDEQQAIYDRYLDHTRFVNNWDLVDTSAEHIVGAHLWARERGVLDALAHSDLLWERRIAVMATFHFIKRNAFDDTLRLAELVLHDPHDLIHKAVGWMLREIGKRDGEAAETFLRRHHREMPRTMLRYAIERFPEALRKHYMQR